MTKIVAEKYPQTGKFNKIQLSKRSICLPPKRAGEPQTPKPETPHPGTT